MQMVIKKLLQFYVQELHNTMMSPPEYGGIRE